MLYEVITDMNGLALGELGIVSGPRNTQNGKRFNRLVKKANGQRNNFV